MHVTFGLRPVLEPEAFACVLAVSLEDDQNGVLCAAVLHSRGVLNPAKLLDGG